MLKKLRKKLVSLIQIIFLIYLIMLIYLYFNQRNLMYHPNENNYIGDKISVRIEKVKINTSDNIDLLGWFHKKDLERYKTILFFHGNAGTLENRIHKLNYFGKMKVLKRAEMSVEDYLQSLNIQAKDYFLEDNEHFNFDYHTAVAEKYIPWLKNS